MLTAKHCVQDFHNNCRRPTDCIARFRKALYFLDYIWNVISFRDLDNSHDVDEIFLTTFEISSVFETWTILMIALASSTFRLLTLSWGNDLEFHLDSFSFMKSFMVPKTWEYLKWKGSTTSHRQLHSIADGLCSQSYIHSTIEQFSSLLLADGAAVISPLWSLPMMLSSMFSINLGLPLDQSLWRSSHQVRRYNFKCSERKFPPLRSVHALSIATPNHKTGTKCKCTRIFVDLKMVILAQRFYISNFF